jgi:glycogen operon protein
MPRSIVVDGRFNWEGVESPSIIWPRLIVYEAHVKGFTMRHPDIPDYLRGTYGGFAHPVTIDYLGSWASPRWSSSRCSMPWTRDSSRPRD